MSEIIFPQQVLPEINWDNPLSDYVAFAVMPNEGSGDILHDLVSGQEFDFSSVGLTWNADGSVTASSSLGVPVNGLNTVFENDDHIIIASIKRHTNTSGSRQGIFYFGNWSTGRGSYFSSATYNGGVELGVNQDYNGLPFTIGTLNNKRTEYVGLWQPEINTLSGFVDGTYVTNRVNSDVSSTYTAQGTFYLGSAFDFYNIIVLKNKNGAFTQDEIDSIVANPYQLFKTAETKREEYALTFDATATQEVSLPELLSTNVGGSNIHWSLESVAAMVSNETLIIAGNDSDSGAFYVLNNGKVVYRDNGATTVDWISAVPTGELADFNKYKLTMIYDGSTRSFELFINDVSQGVKTSGSIAASMTGFDSVGNHNGTYRNLKSKYLSFIDHNVAANSRLWIFDKKDNPTTINDEYNGAVATLSGFPEYSGYVWENDEITGYQFNNTSYASLAADISIAANDDFDILIDATPSVSGNYFRPLGGSSITTRNRVLIFGSGTVRLSNLADNDVDWSTGVDITTIETLRFERVGGVLNLYINDVLQSGGAVGDTSEFLFAQFNANAGAISTYSNEFRRITFSINSITTNDYLFNTVGSDSLIDVIGNNHGTIVNAATAGFLPVIEKQVYTVGAGKDYATAKLYEAGVQLTDTHKVGLVYGNTGETATVSIVDQVGFFELRAVDGEEAKPDGLGAKIGTASISAARSKLLIKNLQLYNYINTGAPDATADEEIDGCVIDNGGAANGITFGTNKLAVKNTLVKNCDRGAYSASYRDNTTFLDCVFIDNGDYNCLRANTYNCVATGATTGDYLQAQGDYNVSSDATAVGANSQINATITLDANGLIDQTTQDTYLVGKGWNGSDIASSFYATAASGTVVSMIAGSSWSIRDYIESSEDVLWAITETLTSQQGVSWSIREDVNTLAPTSWSIRGNVSKDSLSTWSILESVAKEQSTSWHIRNDISSSYSTSWAIDDFGNTVSSVQQLSWGIREEILSAVNQSWTIRGDISTDNTLSWMILEDVSDTTDTSWSIRKGVEDTSNLSWQIREVISRISADTWEIRGYLDTTQPILWDIDGRDVVQSTTPSCWNVNGEVSSITSVFWDITTTLSGIISPVSRTMKISKQFRQVNVPKQYRTYLVY